MKEYLDNLRAKPDHVKRRIALFTSSGITVAIFLFWVASFGIQSGGVLADGSNGTATSTGSAVSKVGSPVSSLTASVSDAAGNIFGGMWNTIKTSFTSKPHVIDTAPTVEVVPGNR